MDDNMKETMSKVGFREDFDPNNRIVEQEDVEVGDVIYYVSTVDLGLDHNLLGGEPLYYETMVFIKDGDVVDFSEKYMERYSTKSQALGRHNKIIASLKNNEFTVNKDGYITLK